MELFHLSLLGEAASPINDFPATGEVQNGNLGMAKLGFIASSEGWECQLCSSLHLSSQLGPMLQLQPPLVCFVYGTRIFKLFFFSLLFLKSY